METLFLTIVQSENGYMIFDGDPSECRSWNTKKWVARDISDLADVITRLAQSTKIKILGKEVARI